MRTLIFPNEKSAREIAAIKKSQIQKKKQRLNDDSETPEPIIEHDEAAGYWYVKLDDSVLSINEGE